MMKQLEKYDYMTTHEYRCLLNSTSKVLGLLLFLIGALDLLVLFYSPYTFIKLYVAIGVVSVGLSFWLSCASMRRFMVERDFLGYVEWFFGYVFMVVGMMPLLVYLYLNTDWSLVINYGKEVLFLYRNADNLVLPISIMTTVCLFYWISTIQLVKSSKIPHLSLIKKRELYEKED